MARLTISDAARVAGVARSTLHRAIKHGRLSVDTDGHIDTADLLRAGYTLQRNTQQSRSGAQPSDDPFLAQQMALTHQERELLRLERDLLRQELDAAHAREQAALEREQAAREREALLLHLVEQMHQHSQRFLEAGRRVPAPPGRLPVSAPPAAEDWGPVPAAFDPRKYVLGKLCPRGHAYHDTGQSLLRLPGRVCPQCDAERARKRRQTQRTGAQSKE